LDISDSVAGLKVEKSGGVAVGEGECGETGAELLSRERRSSTLDPCAPLSHDAVAGSISITHHQDNSFTYEL